MFHQGKYLFAKHVLQTAVGQAGRCRCSWTIRLGLQSSINVFRENGTTHGELVGRPILRVEQLVPRFLSGSLK